MATGDTTSVVSDAELVERWDRGERAAAIARAVGLTRQRVDQRLKRNGRTGPNHNALPAADSLLAAARAAFAMDELAIALQQTPKALELALMKHGLRDKVLEMLEGNRRARAVQARLSAQQDYVRRLRAIAVEVQHTPTIDELERRDIYHARLAQLFGSAPAAMRAAGLEPNQPGTPPAALPPDFGDDVAPTSDEAVLDGRAARLIMTGELTDPPFGNAHPGQQVIHSTVYYRDPRVVAWVRQRARGICEACGSPGYETDKGVLFLEVHHLVPLADGGPDIVSNAVAVCETCHGKLHRWVHRAQMLPALRAIASEVAPNAL